METQEEVCDWSSPILTNPETEIKTLKCRPRGKTGMIKYVEVTSRVPVRSIIEAISLETNISYSTFEVFNEFKASGIVITKNSPVCRAVSSITGFCSQCSILRQGTKGTAKWQITVSDKTSYKQFLSELQREGIEATVTELGGVTNNNALTFEQDRAIRLAVDEGYFRFPRQTSLRRLSKMLGISASTLDEILRRAEGKIVSEYLGNPRRGRDRESD